MPNFLKNIRLPQYANRPSRKTLLKAFLLMMAVTYVIYHFLQGNRGLLALLDMREIVAKEQQSLAQLQRQHAQLQHRIDLLRPQHLSIDMLDERARVGLNLAENDEIIVSADDILSTK